MDKVCSKRCRLGLVLLTIVGCVVYRPLLAENGASDDLASALENSSINLNFRYRYEYVDQASLSDNANASTLRTRLVYKSGEFKNTFLTLNMDDIRPIVGSDFNDTRNGKAQYPVVADPKGTDINLASLTFTGLDGGTIVLGRQRIIRENARFIGNVGWRQNEQTYDSASIDYALTDKLQVFYAYVDGVERIFGPDDAAPPAPSADLDSNTSLLDVAYTFGPELRLAGYGYLIDLEDAPASSSRTVGARLTGSVGDDVKVSYTAEFAQQQDYKDNANDYDENYYHLVAGVDTAQFGFKVGYEVLGGSGAAGESFQTPLATAHKFNGLADLFLSTPAGGLEDAYISATAKILGGDYTVVYHDFSQETGSASYGTEIDFIAKWSVLENYSVLAGFGLFDSKDGFKSDTDKVWLMLTADF